MMYWSKSNDYSGDFNPTLSGQSRPTLTVAVFEHNDTIFYLIAMSELDAENNAQVSRENLVRVLTQLINYYDRHGNGYDLYLPLLGTGLSRAGLTHKEAFELITSMLRIYADKIHGCTYVVVHSKDRDKVSLQV